MMKLRKKSAPLAMVACILILLFVLGRDEAHAAVPDGALAAPYSTLEGRIKAELEKIADGRRTNTIVSVNYSDLGITAEDISANLNHLSNVIIRDCASALYWWDGTYGEDPHASGGTLTMKFKAAKDYRNTDYEVLPAKIAAAQASFAAADAIIEEYASLGDEAKIQAYFDRIRALCDYDYDTYNATLNGLTAADVGSNPWNMIYVFDGDPETKVICTGFSKAFEYLCDNSHFSEDIDIDCICASGETCNNFNGQIGTHTWNLIMINGDRFMMDVTLGSYLLKPLDGDLVNGYTYRSGRIYRYDELTTDVFGTDRLTLPREFYWNSTVDAETGDLTLYMELEGELDFKLYLTLGGHYDHIIFGEGLTSICDYAFQHCDMLQTVTLPASLESIGSSAFAFSVSLRSVTWPENSRLSYIGDRAFMECYELSGTMNIPGTVPAIQEYTFYKCENLEGVTLNNGTTSIGDYAFYECTRLTDLTLSDTITSLGKYVCYNCSSLQTLQTPLLGQSLGYYFGATTAANGSWIPASLRQVTITKASTVPNSYFSGCSGLTSVTIPDTVTSIGSSAFSGCSGLTSVSIPSSLTSLGSYAFYNCSSITGSITLPEAVTLLPDRAFLYCAKLEEIHLGGALTEIQVYALWGCPLLTDIYFDNTEAAWANVVRPSGWGPTSATVHFRDLPRITAQPANVTAPTGTKVYFSVTAAGTGTLTYKWQWSPNGSAWYDTSLTGYNTPTLTVTASDTVNGRYYRCTVTNASGSTASDSAKLTVGAASKPAITAQPVNATAPTGTKVYFSVTATGTGTLTYKWQWSPNGSAWYDTSLTGYNTPTLTVTASDTVNGRYYRCTVSNSAGSTVSNSAKLTVGAASKPTITAQPVNAAVPAGTKVYFSVTAVGTGTLTYKWQWSPNGSTWYDTSLTGYNTPTLTVTASATVNGRYYRCTVTNTAGSTTSNPAKLTLAAAPLITAHPANVTKASGEKAYFTVMVTGTEPLTYRWQYSTNNSTWNDTSLTGYNTKTLTVTASAAVNGRYYRCIVTNAMGSAASNSARLTVSSSAKPTITGQPVSVTKAAGAKAYFTVTASGTGTLTYQWQYSVNGTTWNNTSLSGYNTKTLTVTASAAVNGRYYRCIVSNASGSVISSSARLTVTVPPTITVQPKNTSVAAGSKAYITVTATGTGTLTYKWQWSPNGSTWYDTSLTGYNTKTLTVTGSNAVNGRYYRCIVTDTNGSVTTTAAKLTVT